MPRFSSICATHTDRHTLWHICRPLTGHGAWVCVYTWPSLA